VQTSKRSAVKDVSKPNPLLKCSGRTQNERRHLIEVVFLEKTYRHAITQFGIDTHEPCLNDCRRIMGSQSHDNMIGKSQALLRLTVRFLSFNPAVDSPGVFDAGHKGGQLFPNN